MKNAFILFLILFTCSLNAQQIIELNNPSFEDLPRASKTPISWIDCHQFLESPTDIQPGFFEVEMEAQEGETYLGMVVKNNNTWESIAQELNSPLLKSQPYVFNIYLARSPSFLAQDRKDDVEGGSISNVRLIRDEDNPYEMINYTEPTILRVWGGNDFNDKRQLLTQTAPIYNNSWEKYTLEFVPEEYWKYIMLEVYYSEDREGEYCGNLMVDNCSEVRPIDLLEYNQIHDLSPTILNKESVNQFSAKDIKNTIQYIIRNKSSNIPDSQLQQLSFLKKLDDMTFFNQFTFNEIRYAGELEELEIYVNYLEEIGLEEELDIIKKMLQLFQFKKEQKITKEDKRFIKEYRSFLIEDFFKETVDHYFENYIQSRKEEIVKEILLCLE